MNIHVFLSIHCPVIVKLSKLPLTNWSPSIQEEESVSNRVAGFICKYILTEHKSCVTSMCVVHKSFGYDNTFLVSGGWDHRLCIWNLDDGRFVENNYWLSVAILNFWFVHQFLNRWGSARSWNLSIYLSNLGLRFTEKYAVEFLTEFLKFQG